MDKSYIEFRGYQICLGNHKEVVHKVDNVALDEIVEEFKYFLLSMSFSNEAVKEIRIEND